jgi:LPXTG-motif cell wall-anchored protein
MESEIKSEQPIENVVEEKKEKQPIHKVVMSEVVGFVDRNGYSSIAIGVGLIAGIFLYVKYKRKK